MSSNHKETMLPNIKVVLKTILSHTENISGLELSKRTGLPVATVNRLLSGTVTDPRVSTLKPLANYFGLSVDQLLGYAPLPKDYDNNGENLLPSLVIPIYNISTFTSLEQKPTDSFTWVTQTTTHKEKNFALLVDHQELQPVFDTATILVVEPHYLPAQNNDYLAVMFHDTNKLCVKRFLLDAGSSYFMPLNPRLKALPTSERAHTIIGIITEAHTKLRN